MIIPAFRQWQLCNRLQRVAHSVAFAHEFNTWSVNMCLQGYEHLFDAPSKDPWLRFPTSLSGTEFPAAWQEFVRYIETTKVPDGEQLKRFSRDLGKPIGVADARRFSQRVHLEQQEQICRHADDLILLIYGHFFYALDLVKKHADVVREYLAPAEPNASRLREYVSELRSRDHTLVGVHIRRGDYRDYESGRWFFSNDVYLDHMKRFLRLFSGPSPLFLICSDEPLRSEDFSAVPHVMGPGEAILDLYALAACDWMLSTKTTFAAWASFYGSVPRYVIHGDTPQFKLDEFWVCDDLRGNISAGGVPYERSGHF